MAVIKNHFLILLILLGIESLVLYLSKHPAWRKLFSIIPFICWIFFLPMVISSLGLIDPKSILYKHITDWLLPASLTILLMTVDLKTIFRLGPMALGTFLIGSLSVGVGMVIAFKLFAPIVGAQYWSGFGALTGSWTGGSANMIAVKEALSTPDEIFLPFVVVDAILPYLWMALLMAGANWQHRFDEMNHVNPDILRDLKQRVDHLSHQPKPKITPWAFAVIMVIGVCAAFAAGQIAAFLPAVKDVISPFAWVVILASVIGLALSYTPAKKLESRGSNTIGYFLLYLVLTTIGAKANLSQIGQSFILMFAGITVIAIHASALLLTCRWGRVPLCLAAAASQANLGGVASAPIVAEIYCKGLAPVGLLLAIFGNIIGTYIGITVGQICRMVAG